MKIQNSIPTTVKAVALACAFSLVAVTTSQAVFVSLPNPTAETPGVVLPSTVTGGGTVLAVKDVNFADNAVPIPFAIGSLRSFVVDRGGGFLDFYYQLINMTDAPDSGFDEFFRMSIPGFAPSWTLTVAQTTSLAGLLPGSSGFVAGSYATGSGLEDAATADRGEANANSVGFDFPFQPPLPFIGYPRNVGAGEASTFLVVRTDAIYYEDVTAVISGAATSFAGTFGASASATSVPETGGSLVFGLTLAGICWAGHRSRSSQRSDGSSHYGLNTNHQTKL